MSGTLTKQALSSTDHSSIDIKTSK